MYLWDRLQTNQRSFPFEILCTYRPSPPLLRAFLLSPASYSSDQSPNLAISKWSVGLQRKAANLDRSIAGIPLPYCTGHNSAYTCNIFVLNVSILSRLGKLKLRLAISELTASISSLMSSIRTPFVSPYNISSLSLYVSAFESLHLFSFGVCTSITMSCTSPEVSGFSMVRLSMIFCKWTYR